MKIEAQEAEIGRLAHEVGRMVIFEAAKAVGPDRGSGIEIAMNALMAAVARLAGAISADEDKVVTALRAHLREIRRRTTH
jgi:hypothetical protein